MLFKCLTRQHIISISIQNMFSIPKKKKICPRSDRVGPLIFQSTWQTKETWKTMVTDDGCSMDKVTDNSLQNVLIWKHWWMIEMWRVSSVLIGLVGRAARGENMCKERTSENNVRGEGLRHKQVEIRYPVHSRENTFPWFLLPSLTGCQSAHTAHAAFDSLFPSAALQRRLRAPGSY